MLHITFYPSAVLHITFYPSAVLHTTHAQKFGSALGPLPHRSPPVHPWGGRLLVISSSSLNRLMDSVPSVRTHGVPAVSHRRRQSVNCAYCGRYEPLFRLDGCMFDVLAIAYSRDATKLVSGSSDKIVRLWSASVRTSARSARCTMRYPSAMLRSTNSSLNRANVTPKP